MVRDTLVLVDAVSGSGLNFRASCSSSMKLESVIASFPELCQAIDILRVPAETDRDGEGNVVVAFASANSGPFLVRYRRGGAEIIDDIGAILDILRRDYYAFAKAA